MSNSSFYVDLTSMAESQRASLRMKPRESPSIPTPDLLPGEIMVCEVPNVLRFDAMGENKKGISGTLCATNFRVSFITAGMYGNKRQSIFHSNPDLSEDAEGFPSTPQSQDAVLIPQACIMHICSVHGEKIKKINPGHVFKSKLETLVIHCKDFRIISFGFKFCSKEHQRKIVNAILHYSYPSSISRLFAFDYIHDAGLKNNHSGRELFPTYRSELAWEQELERLNSKDRWRVTDLNADYNVSDSLGQFMVCPKVLTDQTIEAAAKHYTNGRLPFWCWNHPETGVPLLCCSTGLPESDLLDKYESNIFDTIKSTYPKGKQTPITIFDVSRNCASPKDLEMSYAKVRELCMHENERDFWAGDTHWMTNIDGTRWLGHIRSTLIAAYAVSKLVYENAKPVVVRELSGRDMSLVVGSIAQIIMDPHYRTIEGFQCLIQKMWVIFGHPFAKRVAHIKVIKKDEKDENAESPVFLHFLDCVQQLLVQFPSAFEFSETYLLGILDCVYSCMFETFLFDSESERTSICAQEDRANRLASFWDYIMDNLPSTEFSLFLNPLYEFQRTSLITEDEKPKEPEPYLVGRTDPPCLRFWTSCFLRWLPAAKETVSQRGHCPSKHLQQMILFNRLKVLKRQMAMLEADLKGYDKENVAEHTETSRDSSNLDTIGDFKATLLSSLSGPFSFAEFSLNPLMAGKNGTGREVELATQV